MVIYFLFMKIHLADGINHLVENLVLDQSSNDFFKLEVFDDLPHLTIKPIEVVVEVDLNRLW